MTVPQNLFLFRKIHEDFPGYDVFDPHEPGRIFVQDDTLDDVIAVAVTIMLGFYLITRFAVVEVKTIKEQTELVKSEVGMNLAKGC